MAASTPEISFLGNIFFPWQVSLAKKKVTKEKKVAKEKGQIYVSID